MKRHRVHHLTMAFTLTAPLLVVAGCDSAGTTGAAAGAGSRTIGVSFDLLNATRQAEKAAIQKAAAAAGYQTVFDVADQDAQKQASQIQDLVETQHVSAIIAIAQDGRQITSSIGLAKAHHVPFVAVDRAVADQADVSFQVTSNPSGDGAMAAAQFMAEGRPLKVLELVGSLSDQNAIGRRDGFDKGLAGNAVVTIAGQVPTDWDPTQALDGTANALQQDPGIDAIFIPSDFLLPSVESALKSAGRLYPLSDPKHVFIVTIDGDQNGCAALKSGYIDADIATPVDQFATDAISAVGRALAGQSLTSKTTRTEGVTLNRTTFAAVSAQVWGCGS